MPLAELSKRQISDKDLISEYNRTNNQYHKIAVKSTESLITVLENTPDDTGSIVRNPIDKGLFEILFGINFRFYSNGILVSSNIFFYFDKKFSKKELNKIDDCALLDALINRIKHKKGINKNDELEVYDFEKLIVRKNLLMFRDKINYKRLREILTSDTIIVK